MYARHEHTQSISKKKLCAVVLPSLRGVMCAAHREREFRAWFSANVCAWVEPIVAVPIDFGPVTFDGPVTRQCVMRRYWSCCQRLDYLDSCWCIIQHLLFDSAHSCSSLSWKRTVELCVSLLRSLRHDLRGQQSLNHSSTMTFSLCKSPKLSQSIA